MMKTELSTLTLQQSTNGFYGNLDRKIEHLANLDRKGLIERWEKVFVCLPYKGIRNPTLIRALAYQEQVKMMGELKPSVSRKLIKLAKAELNQDLGNDTERSRLNSDKLGSKKIKPRTQLGCRLMREWNGRTYEVVVADKGYILNGITHRSLSACAKTITGAHWSGPRFFGVAA